MWNSPFSDLSADSSGPPVKRRFESSFRALITDVCPGQGPLTGWNCYSWQEQYFKMTLPEGVTQFTLAQPPGQRYGNGTLSQQCLFTVSSTSSGGFTVSSGPLGGHVNIPFNATAAQVQAMFEADTSVGTGNVLVFGGPLPGFPLFIQFGNKLASQWISPLLVSNDTTNGASVSGVVSPALEDTNLLLPNFPFWADLRILAYDGTTPVYGFSAATRIVRAQITGVQAGAGAFAGMNVYSWQQVQLNSNPTPVNWQPVTPPATPLPTPMPPMAGTFDLSPALEDNNTLLSVFPFYADLRIIGSDGPPGDPTNPVSVNPVFGFKAPAQASSGFLGCMIAAQAMSCGFGVSNPNAWNNTPQIIQWFKPNQVVLQPPPGAYDTSTFSSALPGTDIVIPTTGLYEVSLALALAVGTTSESAPSDEYGITTTQVYFETIRSGGQLLDQRYQGLVGDWLPGNSGSVTTSSVYTTQFRFLAGDHVQFSFVMKYITPDDPTTDGASLEGATEAPGDPGILGFSSVTFTYLGNP